MSAPNRKLTDEQVKEVRQSSESQRVLAKRFGVNKNLIAEIRAGTIYRDVAALVAHR